MRWWWWGGGLGLLGRGIAPSSLSSNDSKENFCFLGAGWGGWGFAWGGGGGVWGGGGGRLPPPPLPPRSPRPHPCSPTSPHSPPPHTPSPASEPTPWAGSGAAPPIRRSPRAQSPSRGDRAREQGPGVDPGPRCDGGPPRVLPGSRQCLAKATRMGLAFVELTTTSMTCKKKMENSKKVN